MGTGYSQFWILIFLTSPADKVLIQEKLVFSCFPTPKPSPPSLVHSFLLDVEGLLFNTECDNRKMDYDDYEPGPVFIL